MNEVFSNEIKFSYHCILFVFKTELFFKFYASIFGKTKKPISIWNCNFISYRTIKHVISNFFFRNFNLLFWVTLTEIL